MKHGTKETLRIGCILLVTLFLIICAFALFPQPVQATNTVNTPVTSLSAPWGVAVTPNGAYIYVTNHATDMISVINAVTPTVTVSPSSWSMDVGQSETFTANATGGSGTYTSYQWYVGGSAQSGQTASTFSYSPASAGSYSITATVTDNSSTISAQSPAAAVTVHSALIAPTATASKSRVDQGQTSSLTSTAVSTGTSPYTYQWLQMVLGAGSYSSISGATSSSYSFVTSSSTTTGTWSFELQVTDSASAPVVVTSAAVSVVVNSVPTVSITPSSWSMDVGQSETFTANATGGSGTYTSYQWYVGGSAQSGQTASTFSYSPGTSGSHSITSTVTDSLGATSAQSAATSVMVNSALVAPSASASLGTIDQGQTSSLTSTAVSTGTSPYTYQWLQRTPGAGSYQSINGATSASYNFATSGSTTAGTWSFELEVIDAASAMVNSSAATIMVNTAPTVTISFGFAILNVGQSQLFTAIPRGGSGLYDAYAWYVGGVAQSGQTASTYNFSLSSAGSYSITVTVTDSLGATSVQSTAATVSASITVTPTSASTLTPTPTPTPNASPSPTVPEFPYQLLGITLVVFMILVLFAFIIAMRRAENYSKRTKQRFTLPS